MQFYLTRETLKKLYYYKDDLQSLDLNIGVLWSDFSEHKRLYIYDSESRYTRYSDLNKLLKFKSAKDYFTILDLNDYPLERISEMLETIVEHYRTDHKNVELVLDKPIAPELSLSNNYDSGPGKLKKTRKKKKLQTKRKNPKKRKTIRK